MSRLQAPRMVAGLTILGVWIASTTASFRLAAEDRHARPAGEPPRVGGMMGGPAAMPMLLLGSPKVRKELGLSEEQEAKLKELAAKYFRDIRQQMGGLGDLGEEQRREKFAQVQKKTRAQGHELGKKIDDVLSPRQKARFKQIMLQVRGVTALGDKDVAEALGLTDQQKRALKGVGDSAREKLAELHKQRGDLEWHQVREKAQAIQKQSTEKALAALTEEQKEKFEKMKGPKLDLDLPGLVQGGERRGKR